MSNSFNVIETLGRPLCSTHAKTADFSSGKQPLIDVRSPTSCCVADRPKLLDLYCDVVGVDLVPQPRYPFEFVHDGALWYARKHGSRFDAIPPAYTRFIGRQLMSIVRPD